MTRLIFENADADERRAREFINAQGFAETSPKCFRVATGLDVRKAVARLTTLAGDMLENFDLDPTAIEMIEHGKCQFANQIGVFYIDYVTE